MADATQPMEDFSPVLIQNYIRFETAYNLVQNEDAGNAVGDFFAGIFG